LRDNKIEIKELKYTYSLEHIMPQKWEEFWEDVPVIDINGNQIVNNEQAKQYRYRLIYELGNMTLLKSALNSSLRNYEFARKVKGEGRKKGIKVYAELGITKFDIVDKFENGDTIWDERKIKERTKDLAADFFAIWK